MAIEMFFAAIRSQNWAAFIPGPVLRAHQAGLLKFEGTDVAGWRMAKLGFPFLTSEQSTPIPSFLDETEWKNTLSLINIPVRFRGSNKMPVVSIPYGEEVFDLSVLDLHFQQAWDTGGAFAGTHEGLHRLEDEFHLHLWDPLHRGYLRRFKGAIAICRRRYGPQEITKARRRIEDIIRKNDADVIRVAKFLKLK